jgi:hypothetical protein
LTRGARLARERKGQGICLGEFLEQFGLLFGGQADGYGGTGLGARADDGWRPVSATASSTQSRPSATLRTRRATSPSFVNLQALLSRLSRICLSLMASRVERAQVLLGFDDEAVLVLLGELSGGADDLIDKPC